MSFPGEFGIIGVGDGKVVLPAPPVQTAWNPFVRGPEDGVFRWGLVTGLEPVPDLGYQFVEPEYYQLEITPDLGWSNKEELFVPYLDPTQGNPRLRVFKQLALGTDLIVKPGESCTYELSAAIMRTILAPGFENYLWRVRAVAPSGHEGYPSDIQFFRGKVWVPNLAWTINDLPARADGMTVLISGRRSSLVVDIEINGSSNYVSFPSPDTWQAEVPLAGGRNFFFIRAYDAQGNGSDYRQVEIEAYAATIHSAEYWNRFDDFGYKMGLARLPRERNLKYRERIKDVFRHRASSLYPGLMNAVTRELALPYYDQGMVIKVAVNQETGRAWDDIQVWLNARHFCLQRSSFLSRDEYHVVEGRTWQVRPNLPPNGVLRVDSDIGNEIPAADYVVRNDFRGTYIQFLDSKYSGRVVHLTYQYVVRIETAGKTVQQLATEIEAVRINGKQVLVVTVHPAVASSPAATLQHFPPTIAGLGSYEDAGGETAFGIPVRWAPAKLLSFVDPEVIALYGDERGNLWGSAYEGYAFRLKNKVRTTWGYLQADRAVWTDPKIRVGGIGRVPHHYDARKGVWTSTIGQDAHEVDAGTAAMRGYSDPRDRSLLAWRGVPWRWFQSGYSWGYALFTLVDQTPYSIISEAEEFEVVRQVAEGTPFAGLGLGDPGNVE